MKTKIFTFLLVLGFLIIGTNVFAQTDISLDDRKQITANLDSLSYAINQGDEQVISTLISPNNEVLKLEIQERIKGGMSFKLDYSPFDKNVEVIGVNKIKIKGRFAASGFGWSVSGLSTYFVFEKQDNQWLITDTNFYKKVGVSYIFSVVKKIFIFTGPIALLFFVFWFWMLIDCIKRKFNDKALWIILLIFLNFIAAILYFFIVKRKNITRKPLEFKM